MNSEKLGIDNSCRIVFLSLRMNKCLERFYGRHFWNPGVFRYALIPRCRPNSRVIFSFIVASIVYSPNSNLFLFWRTSISVVCAYSWLFSSTGQRLRSFLETVINSSSAEPTKFPPGLTAVHEELKEMAGTFLQLTVHNRRVFMSYYVDIIDYQFGIVPEPPKDEPAPTAGERQDAAWFAFHPLFFSVGTWGAGVRGTQFVAR